MLGQRQAGKAEHKTTSPQFKEEVEWRCGAFGASSEISAAQISRRARQMVMQSAQEEAVTQSLSRPLSIPSSILPMSFLFLPSSFKMFDSTSLDRDCLKVLWLALK